MTPEKIGFRFTRLYTPAIVLFVFCNALMGPYLNRSHGPDSLHWLGAILTAISILAAGCAMRQVLYDCDEYIRKLTMDALLIAIVMTLTVTSAYGYLLTYYEAPDVSFIFIAPVFMAFFAAVTCVHYATGKYK